MAGTRMRISNIEIMTFNGLKKFVESNMSSEEGISKLFSKEGISKAIQRESEK
jgi:hypothetical protein